MNARKKRRVLASDSRYLEEDPLAYSPVGVEGSQASVGAHLIREHQSLWIDAAEFRTP